MKLSAWVWLVLGLSLGLAVLAVAWFKYYAPNMKEAQMLKDNGDQLQAQVNLTQKAVERRQKAADAVAAMGVSWNEVVVRKTPPANVADGGINVSVNRWQLTVDAAKFRESLQKRVNYQTRLGGVKVIQGAVVPQPTESGTAILSDYFNYPAIKFPVCVFNLGQVTVRGTWPQIRENFRAWSTMPNYLVVADGLNISGTTPDLTATYNVSLVAYIRGGEVAPLVPEGAAQGGAGGGGGIAPGGPAPGGANPGAPAAANRRPPSAASQGGG